MSVNPIAAIANSVAGAAANALSLHANDDFKRTLLVGQILKGRVLLRHESGNYLVDFGGHQKVVESATPLQTNEILHGRVVAIGERVELQRVRVQDAASRDEPAAQPKNFTPMSDAAALLGRQFGFYQVAALSNEQTQALEASVRTAQYPENMALAAVLLAKLGLSQRQGLLQTVYQLMAPDRRAALFRPDSNALLLSTATKDAVPVAGEGDLIDEAAKLIASLSDATRNALKRKSDADSAQRGTGQEYVTEMKRSAQKTDSNIGHSDKGKGGEVDYSGWLLLNSQPGGSVSHKVETIPILVDEQLVEVDIAAFEQSDERSRNDATRHRQVVFALDTKQLGRLEINARIAGSHIRVSMCADTSDGTEKMALHSGALQSRLVEAGWAVDELKYETSVAPQSGLVPRTVVEHLISKDSLDRLI